MAAPLPGQKFETGGELARTLAGATPLSPLSGNDPKLEVIAAKGPEIGFTVGQAPASTPDKPNPVMDFLNQPKGMG